MSKKSSFVEKTRIPPEFSGIQVNFCKNPTCANFGIPASQNRPYKKAGTKPNIKAGEAYTIAASGKNQPILKCQVCGEHPVLKSNQGIAEELFRITAYMQAPESMSCPNDGCPNHGIGIDLLPDEYKKFGKTKDGSQRYRCKSCGKTFSQPRSSTQRQRQAHKNRQIFSLLMNKSPFRRILEVADISAPTLYNKIDFIHRQCLKFARNREKSLLNQGETLRRINVSVDRQDYVVNWNQKEDRRNVVLHAVGSADNKSGYVFGMNLNFDPRLNRQELEEEALENGDYESPPPFRRYARLWLEGEYDDSLVEFVARAQKRRQTDGSVLGDVAATYAESQERADIEASDVKTTASKLPPTGAQIHSEYTLYAHFMMLKAFFKGMQKVNFYLDQDSGMRAACFGAFHEEVLQRRADAFYVRVKKEATITEKRNAVMAMRVAMKRRQDHNPNLTPQEVEFMMIHEQMLIMEEIGKWSDRWLNHPLPSMTEPEKAVCFLTDLGDTRTDDLTWMYYLATLHGIDRFFMQVRRRLSLLERAIGSASSGKRKWHGYSAYNPEVIIKLLEIFRVYYNYVLIGKDKKTPAMRFGLASAASSIEDILYYV